jgi:enoyl-CoA hydratase
MSTTGQLVYEKHGPVARVAFDNPSAHNALTKGMWSDLRDAARDIANDPAIRVATFRGIGGKAFVSGTDISGFARFSSGRDGVAYENDIDECMSALDAIPVTTVAIVDGWAIGGGLNISSACDFRIATPNARFGSPIGRTIGNCLSAASCARVAAAVGPAIGKRMVLLGEIVPAEMLLANGFLPQIVEPDQLDAAVESLCTRAIENAPLTTRATKETFRRMTMEGLPNIDPLIESVYGSEDFALGVRDFLAKTKALPSWSGR